ncbi:hypothetical protein Trydic_g8395 [Trypoxylus dichotomus]
MEKEEKLKEFAIVEFPEEEVNGSIPLGIISTTWLVEENCETYCLWPSYIKNASEREKIIVNRLSLDKAKCDKCYVNVVYSSSHYQNAINKLKLLEKASNIPLM